MIGAWTLSNVGFGYFHRGRGISIRQRSIDPVFETFKIPDLKPLSPSSEDPIRIVLWNLSDFVEFLARPGSNVSDLDLDPYHFSRKGWSV